MNVFSDELCLNDSLNSLVAQTTPISDQIRAFGDHSQLTVSIPVLFAILNLRGSVNVISSKSFLVRSSGI